MVVLVTGGAGFIGSHLCELLRRKGYGVVCLDDFSPNYAPDIKERNISWCLSQKSYRLVRGSFLDVNLLDQVLQGDFVGNSGPRRLRPEAVVHLGALPGVRLSLEDPVPYAYINALGTATLLERVKEAGIQQFVFASSSSVYGDVTALPFSENAPVSGNSSPYAATKLFGEALCHLYHKVYGLSTTVVRLFTVYGPRQRPDMAIHKFAGFLISGKPVPMYGDGETTRDYTYIDDCVTGLVATIEKGFGFEVLNIGSSRQICLGDIVHLIAKELGVRPLIQRVDLPSYEIRHTCADITKARQLLSYTPNTRIEEGIRHFTDWFLDNRCYSTCDGGET